MGLRELRQHASELVRQVETGEEVTITVAGRPSARLVPIGLRQWRTFDDIADLFGGEADADWERDRELIDQRLRNPWDHE
ncbi:prevent-host-death family protein [Prauserella muralis]|nr:prevent-host-death family protein [Prauserella muralis]